MDLLSKRSELFQRTVVANIKVFRECLQTEERREAERVECQELCLVII